MHAHTIMRAIIVYVNNDIPTCILTQTTIFGHATYYVHSSLCLMNACVGLSKGSILDMYPNSKKLMKIHQGTPDQGCDLDWIHLDWIRIYSGRDPMKYTILRRETLDVAKWLGAQNNQTSLADASL